MLINQYSNYNQNFNGINVRSTRMFEKEGAYAISRLEFLKDKFSKYKWCLNIDSDNYSLTSPTTKKTYKGPFTIKRHVIKKANRPDEYTVIVRMSDNKQERFSVNFDSPQDAFEAYKGIKKSSGLDKMIKLLEILERGLNINILKKQIDKIQKLTISEFN